MDKTNSMLIELVSLAIQKGNSLHLNMDDINWEEIYKRAVKQQVYTLIYPVIKNIDSSFQPEKTLLSTWKTRTFRFGIMLELNIHKIEEILKQFLGNGIKPILLKGLVFKTLYPQSQLRFMSDMDILVEDQDIEKVSAILISNGYIPKKDKKTKHIQFFHKKHFCIEIHRTLNDDDNIKNQDDFLQAIWESKIEFKLNSITIYTLSWEHQILHMCIHMASHFLHGGFILRQLCDVVLLVDQKDLNWSYVVNKSKEYGIYKFMCAIFSVCNQLFHTKIPDEFNIIESVDSYTSKVIDDMFLGGKDIISMSENIATKGKDKLFNNNKLRHIFSMLFPSYDKISKRYSYMYIKNHPALTPVAWIHRIIYGIFRKDFSMKVKKSMLNDKNLLKTAEERDDMLHWLEII